MDERANGQKFKILFLSLRSVAQASWDLFCHFFGTSGRSSCLVVRLACLLAGIRGKYLAYGAMSKI